MVDFSSFFGHTLYGRGFAHLIICTPDPYVSDPRLWSVLWMMDFHRAIPVISPDEKQSQMTWPLWCFGDLLLLVEVVLIPGSAKKGSKLTGETMWESMPCA